MKNTMIKNIRLVQARSSGMLGVNINHPLSQPHNKGTGAVLHTTWWTNRMTLHDFSFLWIETTLPIDWYSLHDR